MNEMKTVPFFLVCLTMVLFGCADGKNVGQSQNSNDSNVKVLEAKKKALETDSSFAREKQKSKEEDPEEDDIDVTGEEEESVDEAEVTLEEVVPVDEESINSNFDDELAKEDSLTLENITPITPYGNPISFSEMTDAAHPGGSGRIPAAMHIRRQHATCSQKAVERALRWIARHQHRDGGFSFKLSDGVPGCTCENDGTKGRNAATAMALLSFLGAKYTHQSKGRYKKYSRAVGGGLDFLLKRIKFDGSLWERRGEMYSHGMAACALAEAYGMTQDTRLKDPAQSALNYIMKVQDTEGGGWRYKPGQKGDTSVVVWQLMALQSGRLAGLTVPKEIFQKADKFLDSVSSENGSYYGYTVPGKGKATTAIGHLSKIVMNGGREDPTVQRGADIIGRWGPDWSNMYYTYHATQVMHHTKTFDEEVRWKTWVKLMRDPLIAQQAKDGHEEGSWMMEGKDPGYQAGGRLYCTALAAWMLEWLEVYRMPIYGVKAAEEIKADVGVEVLEN